MELNHLPVIDWDLATRLAGNKKDLAEEILGFLIKSLKTDMVTIKEAYEMHDYPSLLRHVHKLHGALCYCGLPRLKTLIQHIETDLKSNIIFNLSTLIKQLESEINTLLNHYPLSPEALKNTVNSN